MLKSLYILVFCICLSACSGDYLAKHDDAISEVTYRQNIAAAYTGSTYLSGDIQSRDIDIWTFPDKKKLPDLVAKFDTAKTRIYIEVYTWTERDTVDAAIRAHARGVDVQVLLEGNVYGSPTINRDTTKKLTDAGIPVYYSDPGRFTFTHAKFFIFDDTYIVST
jgi:phosphatidylserine/phosphatidylglycerophosphate/cardiolipin synthase-like enzyme